MKQGVKTVSALLIATLFGCKNTPNGPITNNYYLSDSLTNPNVRPAVIFTNPANGAVGPIYDYDLYNIPARPLITVQFNKLMNTTNLSASSLRIRTNDTSYTLRIYDYSSPPLRDILILTFWNKYLANKTYTVTVDTTIFDVHRYHLAIPYIFSFTPEPKFRVYSSFPSGNAVNPVLYSSMMIDLNSPVDSTFLKKIQISPPINGRWQLSPNYYTSDSTTVYFNSTDTLSFDTKYTISVSGDAKDARGLTITTPYVFSFSTQPFQVWSSGYSFSVGPQGFAVLNSLNLSFNGNLDTSTVRSSVSISPSLSFGLSFGGYSGFQSAIIYPDIQRMQRGTTYTIALSTSVRAMRGAYLKQPFSFSYTTGP